MLLFGHVRIVREEHEYPVPECLIHRACHFTNLDYLVCQESDEKFSEQLLPSFQIMPVLILHCVLIIWLSSVGAAAGLWFWGVIIPLSLQILAGLAILNLVNITVHYRLTFIFLL